MRTRLAVLLAAVLLSLPAWAQPNDWLDDFSAPQLDARWTRDVSKQGTMAVDARRQLLVLGGKENVYNHLETDLPTDVTSVQVDLNNVCDTAASWSPGVILYWGPDKYVRVMLSLHYGLRMEAAPGPGTVSLADKLRPVADTWYRVRLALAADTITLTVAQPGEAATATAELKRLPEWQGPCRLIMGKGYMPGEGGAPDFDNDYGRGEKIIAVHVDNVVVGQPPDLAARLAASVAAARVEGEQDPQQLHVAVWPNVLDDRTRGTVWLAQGAYQRVCLVYDNLDATHSAKHVSVEIEASRHLAPREIIAGDLPVQVQTSPAGDLVRCVLDFPANFVLPANFHGVDKPKGEGPGWLNWPISPMMPPVFVHFRPESGETGVLRARLRRDGQPGPWTELKAVVLPPLPPPPKADPRHLGFSLWEGAALDPGGTLGPELLANMLQQYQQVGLRRLHLSGGRPLFEAAHRLGLHANLMSWWDYSAQCPPDVTPTPEEKATEPSRYTTICPEIIATGAGTYGRFLESVTTRMRESGADGFMLDYECRPPLCFCDRCRQAFARYAGVTDAAWPQDIKKGGRYYSKWIEFRCDQGARYVKVIGEAARQAKPGCALQAWIAGYDYAGTIESAQIDISKAAQYLTEPEVPHYTHPRDYRDMWTKDVGLASVEMGIQTVQDSLNVTSKPIVFCSTVIYPLGSATPWSDPQILNAQMLAMIGQGVRGLSFWGGHDDGAVDGRFLHLLARWNAVLAAAGPFLWDGKRDDAAVTVQGADGTLVRKHVWLLKNEALVFVVNLTQEDRLVSVQAPQSGARVRDLLTGRAVDLSRPLKAPALDAVMLVLTR
ncbi:hypothetical protein LLH23_05340 [bacterium]|nr:hypothetical protein [bacterium]